MSLRIIRCDAPIPEDLRGAALALGNFDGVHKGHQAVIAAARTSGGQLAAAVFEPHPRDVFHPDGPPFRLQSSAQRARALATEGVEALIEIGFDRALADLGPDEFCDLVLAKRISPRTVIVGFDFRFGRGRAGDVGLLARHGAARGYDVIVVDAVDDAAHPGAKVSSTAIRAALAEGDLREARTLLGRPWAIEGEVIRGFQRGRTIEVPTANVALGAYVRPRFGVYAAWVDVGDGARQPAIANIGVKPTVAGDAAPLLEAHVFDFSDDLYGRTIETQLVEFIREERKFADFGALTAQIRADLDRARGILGA
jgi:riboflavin kinase/FMN adenylyltransferase